MAIRHISVLIKVNEYIAASLIYQQYLKQNNGPEQDGEKQRLKLNVELARHNAELALMSQLESKLATIEQNSPELHTKITASAAYYAFTRSVSELLKNFADAVLNHPSRTNAAHKNYYHSITIQSNTFANTCVITVLDNGPGFNDPSISTLPAPNTLNYDEINQGKSRYSYGKSNLIGKQGGHGRGLCQAYEFLQQLESTIKLGNRGLNSRGHKGARIQFHSALPINKLSAQEALCLKEHHDNAWANILSKHDRRLSYGEMGHLSDEITSGQLMLSLPAHITNRAGPDSSLPKPHSENQPALLPIRQRLK